MRQEQRRLDVRREVAQVEVVPGRPDAAVDPGRLPVAVPADAEAVAVAGAGPYVNTTQPLFIGTTDTGNAASDTLTVNTAPPAPACVPNAMLAQWTLAGGVSGSAVPSSPRGA